MKNNGMLVPVRTNVDLRRCEELNNEIIVWTESCCGYMLNTVKIYWEDLLVLALRPGKKGFFALMKG